MKKIVELFIGLLLFGCNNSMPKKEFEKYILVETNDPRAKGLEILVTAKKDSLLEVTSDRKYVFKKKEGSLYEQRIINDFDGKVLDIVSILTFSTAKDTSFQYHFDLGRYPPVLPLGSDDFSYQIKNIRDGYFITVKSHITEPSNKRVYLYDKNYNIKMIIVANNDHYYNFISPDLNKNKKVLEKIRMKPSVKLLIDSIEN